jgi:hypothetical protein
VSKPEEGERVSELRERGRQERCHLLYIYEYVAYGSIRQHTSAYVSIRVFRSCGSAGGRNAATCCTYTNTSAYVSIRQHTSAYACLRVAGARAAESLPLAVCVCVCVCGSAWLYVYIYVSIRHHTSAYVIIRQNTSAYVSGRKPASSCMCMCMCM